MCVALLTHRRVAAGIMMAGYELGYLLAALCYSLIFPWAGWRWMFFLGVAPALLAIFIRSGVKESPLWLEARQSQQVPERSRITPVVVRGWAFMTFVSFMLWAVFSLYPTFLVTVRHLDPSGVFPYVAIYSVASIFGKPLAGLLVERFGERQTLVPYLLLTIPATLLYTLIDNAAALAIGAVLMGLVANSVFGIVPMYLARRFPPARRGIGVGIGYAMTSLSVAASFIVALVTPVWGLSMSMAFFIAAAALGSAVIAALNTEKWIPADARPAIPLEHLPRSPANSGAADA